MNKKKLFTNSLFVFLVMIFVISCEKTPNIIKYSLTLISGNGGTTNPSPGTYTYSSGTSVSIEAKPNTNFIFNNWSGDASGKQNPLTVIMNSNKTITANFLRQYKLIIATSLGGTTDPAPGTYIYDAGTQVKISTSPETGYVFYKWSGDASGTENQITITMNSDMTITANFTIRTEMRSGILEVVAGSTLQAKDLNVVTFAGSANIDQNGSFSVKASYAEKYQLLFFNSKTSDNPVYIGIYNPSDGKVTANITSTALALTFLNPNLINTDQSQKEQYLKVVQQNSKFLQLKDLLTNAYKTNANTALDYDANLRIYQLAVQLMKETMESLGGLGVLSVAAGLDEKVPTIEDAPGADIKFINPRHIFYAAGVYSNAGDLKEVKTIERTRKYFSFKWGWPPIWFTDPEQTIYALGDGTFKLYLAKGLDFNKLLQLNDPVGRATSLNSGQALLYIIDLVIGFLPKVDLAKLIYNIHITVELTYNLTRAIMDRDVAKFIVNFCRFLVDNREGIAYWIWQETQNNAAHALLNAAAGIVKSAALALKVLSIGNSTAPFFWDLIFAKDVAYNVTQQNGILTSTIKNDPPKPEFSISPPAGVKGTLFTFNASSTTDDNDSIYNLLFRWDWETDGVWDTAWSNNYTATHSFSETGAFLVSLEVKDKGDLVGSIAHNVYIGGGRGTASHVKLFRDNLPWDSNALVTILENLGFRLGSGPGKYEIIYSDKMPEVELKPGEDLVIISNDQDQTFYNSYAASQIRFTNFVFNGGSLFWEACDEGWAEGSIAEAGIILPGDLKTDFDYDWWNYIYNGSLPLVAGLPSKMDHNYASHESFSNLPEGTIIYCINEESEPTLIEFNFGTGWVIVTGQPLEHQYDRVYGSPDMEKLLPRIIAYFTGKPIPQSMILEKKASEMSIRPSHIKSIKKKYINTFVSIR